MSELILKTDIPPEAGTLYFVKPKGANGCLEVYKAKMARGGKFKKKKKEAK